MNDSVVPVRPLHMHAFPMRLYAQHNISLFKSDRNNLSFTAELLVLWHDAAARSKAAHWGSWTESARAPLVPQLEPHKHISPWLTARLFFGFFFLVSHHVVSRSRPMDTRPPPLLSWSWGLVASRLRLRCNRRSRCSSGVFACEPAPSLNGAAGKRARATTVRISVPMWITWAVHESTRSPHSADVAATGAGTVWEETATHGGQIA